MGRNKGMMLFYSLLLGILLDGAPDSQSEQPHRTTVGQCYAQVATSGSKPQKPLSLYEWYRQRYDFISMKDTVFTFESEFKLPPGYLRPDSAELSPFQYWVSRFPLWHRWKPVGVWKGGKAYEKDEVARVVHLPWRGPNYRDCAIPVRILAEFLHYRQREFDLWVIPHLGDTLRYRDWLNGKAYYGGRGEVFIRPGESREPSKEEYYRFLDLCLKNTSYRSLAANCDSIAPDQVAPGDLFIAYDKTGRKGRAYMILNMVNNNKGEKLYAVATGCPEACDFHIPLLNEDRDYPWVTLDRIKSLGDGFPYAGFFRFKER
jgi:hypothetical protein